MSRIKFQNKYRIPSARWRGWNYGDEGAYFVTICTKHREPYFGEIKDGQMQLSEIGKIAHNEWLKSMDIRPDMNLDMECFVVMPNHIHGIVVIGKNEYNSVADDNGGGDDAENVTDAEMMEWFRKIESIPPANHFGPQSKNLASVMRGFKSAVTTYTRKSSIPFVWQARFHDHVIRDDDEFRRIAYYIEQNPKNWEHDILNKQ